MSIVYKTTVKTCRILWTTLIIVLFTNLYRLPFISIFVKYIIINIYFPLYIHTFNSFYLYKIIGIAIIVLSLTSDKYDYIEEGKIWLEKIPNFLFLQAISLLRELVIIVLVFNICSTSSELKYFQIIRIRRSFDLLGKEETVPVW